MGRAIFYCVQCSQRVSDADLESGKGFRVGDRILCADCAPESVKTVSSKRIPAVARPKTGGTSLTPKVPVPAASAQDPPPDRNRMLLGGGVLVVLLVLGALIFLLTRGRSGDHEVEKTVIAPTSGNESTTLPTPPQTREASARTDLARARDFAKAHPDDLSGRLKEFTDLVWKWEGTEAGREAAKDAAAVKAILQEKVNGWMAEVEETIKDLLKSNQYFAASRKIEELKSSHDLPEWRMAAEKRASELFVLGRKQAEAEEAKKRADDKPATLLGEKSLVKPLSEEGKGQLTRWEAAAAKATARDYAGAIADLDRSLPALKEGDVKSEAEDDVALLRKIAALVQESIGALRQRPRGGALAFQVRDSSGAPKRVGGIILQIDADRVELGSGKDSIFVDWSELTATTLTDLAQKGSFDPRTLAALCLLEGEPEAARVFRAELPAKWWAYAEGARARLPKPDPAERSARNLFAAAEGAYRSMETRAAAIESYRSLRADFGSTAFVKSCSERISRRSEAGKEYYWSPADFRWEGSFRLAKSGKLESAKDSDDRETVLNFAELEFAALPGQTYRCWIWVGACCEETFLFYTQGSELSDVDAKTKKKVAVEPGSGFAVPVKHSIRNLKKTHDEHRPKGAKIHPKTAARWEWIEVVLPKYAAPGGKKLRFMTNQAGFSIGGAIVTALRKGPPLEAEIKDLEKVRTLDEPPLPIDPELVGWWSFDEGSGSTLTDQTGKGHTGKLVGNAKWVEGKIGGAIQFPGGVSGAEIPDAEDLRIPGDLTIAVWVRKSAEPVDWTCIFGRGTSSYRNYGVWLQAKTGKYMYQQYAIGGAAEGIFDLYGMKKIELGKWTHLAVTIKGDDVTLYHNGEPDGRGKRPRRPWAQAAPLGLGYAMHHVGVTGSLDDARLYNRALGPEEINGLFEMGAFPAPK